MCIFGRVTKLYALTPEKSAKNCFASFKMIFNERPGRAEAFTTIFLFICAFKLQKKNIRQNISHLALQRCRHLCSRSSLFWVNCTSRKIAILNINKESRTGFRQRNYLFVPVSWKKNKRTAMERAQKIMNGFKLYPFIS